MPVVINTNYAATLAADNLAASNSALQKSLNRLASGSKIVNPADDAGGLAVSMKLSATAHRQAAVNANLGNAVSYLQAEDGALAAVGDILGRISELKTLYGDPTKNADDRANYQAEFAQLQAELTSIAGEAFNGNALFGSTTLGVGTSADAGGATVDIGGVNLMGASAGGPTTVTDHFADLSNWVVWGGSPTVSGGVLTLNSPGGYPEVATKTPYAAPIEVDMQVQFAGSGGHLNLNNEAGNDLVLVQGAPGLGANVWHDVKVTIDSSGNAAVYLDGSGTAAQTATGWNTTATPFHVFQNGAGSTQIRNFSITGTVSGGTSGNVADVAGAGDLGALDLSTVTAALQDVATDRALNGAQQSRLGYASEVLTVNKANVEAANSRIEDVDVAEESTTLARYNILVQAGTAMLSQANQLSQAVLKLIT